MALSRSLLNDPELAKDFTCPICLELLSDPRALPCGHMFCDTCLSSLTVAAATAASQRQVCVCSLCRRRAIAPPNGFPSIPLFRNVIEGFKTSKEAAGVDATPTAPPVEEEWKPYRNDETAPLLTEGNGRNRQDRNRRQGARTGSSHMSRSEESLQGDTYCQSVGRNCCCCWKVIGVVLLVLWLSAVGVIGYNAYLTYSSGGKRYLF